MGKTPPSPKHGSTNSVPDPKKRSNNPMSTDPKTIELLLDRLADAGDVTARKMFGEYGLYCDGVFIGVVCDDNFHIKPTKQTADMTAGLEMAPAYDGARPSLLIPPESWDDSDWLVELVRTTALALARKSKKK